MPLPPPSVIRTLLRLTAPLHARSPFLATLLPSVGLAYALQGAVAVPSIAAQSERFYDASGSVTYLSCTALSLALPALRAKYGVAGDGVGALPKWPGVIELAKQAIRGAGGVWNWRMLFLSAAVGIWATRLGSFLFARILSEGEDSRFKKIRSSPPKFLAAFAAQATWVSLVLLPVLSINALPASVTAATSGIGLLDVAGIALWASGFGMEVVADSQKSQWSKERAEKKHEEQFLTRGLWSKSRHPNYFGETTLWTGVATMAAGVLSSPAALQAMGLSTGLGGVLAGVSMAAASPAFTSFLLLKVSGVPMSEGKYDRRFKGNKDYEKWKRETPMFFPKFW